MNCCRQQVNTIGLNDLKGIGTLHGVRPGLLHSLQDITWPPPSLTSLVAEGGTANLSSPPGDATAQGEKQLFQGHPISLTGETSICSSPGTDLVLHAEVEKGRKIEGRRSGHHPGQVQRGGALCPMARWYWILPGQNFSLRIDPCRQDLRVLLRFPRQDNVKGPTTHADPAHRRFARRNCSMSS